MLGAQQKPITHYYHRQAIAHSTKKRCFKQHSDWKGYNIDLTLTSSFITYLGSYGMFIVSIEEKI